MNPSAPATPAALRTTAKPGALEWIASILVGGLLVFAASMKVFNHGETALGPGTFVLAAGETLFAALLIAFRTRWWAWASAAALFGAFAGFAGFRSYWGSTSCGCFGALSIPPNITMSIDIAIALLATFMAARRSATMSPTGLVATVAGIAAVLGSGVGFAVSDPRPEDFGDDATRLLLELRPTARPDDPIKEIRALMPEVASRNAGGPAWYLYVFNPDCPICQEHLPRMRALQARWADSDILRLGIISMADLQEYANIPQYAWGTPPLTLLVQRGIVARRGSGLDMLEPEAIYAELADAPQADPYGALLELSEVREAVEASANGGPARLIYLYTSTCGACRAHLSEMEEFSAQRPDDPLLQIMSFSHEELTQRGVDPMHWSELRNAYLVRNGELVQTYSANSIPKPIDVLVQVAAGTAGLPQ